MSLINGSPDYKKVLDIATALDIVSRFNNEVDMENPCSYECGSPCCVAGWFEFTCNKSRSNDLGYHCGVSTIEKHLELLYVDEWANQNPEIWGNERGIDIFLGPEAYNYKGKLTLRKIAHHWYQVAERLREIQDV